MKLLLKLILGSGVALALALTGCKSGSGSGSASVRVVNATHGHASIDLLVSGTKYAGPATTGQASSYGSVPSGSQTVQWADSGTVTALASVGPSLSESQAYTLIAYDSNGLLKAAWVGENDVAPAANTLNLRVIDLATDAGAVDVYVTAPGVDLNTVNPNFSVGASGTSPSTAFLAFTPGTYEIRVTANGNKGDLRLDIPSVALANQQNVVVLLTPTLGGALVDGGVLIEQGAYTASYNGNARVRLVSGVPGGTVSASTATTTLASNLPSPSIGSYAMVPPGAAAWTVSVNGAAAAVPPITLSAGSDNTLLVTGQQASPAVSLLVDDNHAPAVTTMANVRLVNGTTDAVNGLTLTVDSAIVANGVVPGSSSAYANVRVQASTTSHFEVSTLPLTPTPIAAIDRTLVAGGVYTVFVLGNTATAITKIWADR
ncbi:MAG: DUF4397 domain-containing protein [Burkholderiales bacterium]|nr:DUF4397 domain-containing protein [Burkholderiales bacterium]